MKDKQHCPRCGKVVENQFCPQCDLETNDRGVIRKEKKSINRKAKSALEFSIEQADLAKKQQESIFAKREEQIRAQAEEDIAFRSLEDYKDQTVEEILKEQESHTLKPVFGTEVAVDEVANNLSMKNDDEVEETITVQSTNQTETDEATVELPFTLKRDSAEVSTEQVNKDEDEQTNNAEAYNQEESKLNNTEQPSAAEERKNEAQADVEKQEHKIVAFIKQNKLWIGIGFIVLVIVGFFLFKTTSANSEKNQIVKINKQINAFYVDGNSSKGYLQKNVDDAAVQPIEQNIKTLAQEDKTEADKLQTKVDNLKRDQDLVNKLNDLYMSAKIQGSQILNPALKENVDVNLTEIKNPQTSLEKAINSGIKDAKEQKNKQEEAKKAVDKIYQNDQVVSTATKDDYLAAKKAVDAVKNINFKKQYSEALRQAGLVFGNE